MSNLVQFLVIAYLVERLVEYIFGKVLSGEAMKYIALATGVALAFAYNLDLLKEAFGMSALWPAGVILTGIICGGGSSLIHDLIEKFGI